MPIRITTWNVNGIRNPFKYTPWNKDRTLQAMFDLLEADIVCFQEVKMPKASMTDDLVFVDGWEAFYSFPQSQTGYSGVAVFTRDSTCRPLRVEEGVTGLLRVPGTPTRYADLPAAEQIGGYPTAAQLRRAAVAPDALDGEGRCLVLEFPLFVLVNVYCPARRNAERTGFRHAFLRALDARVRNLAAAGKNVVLCGDLNIARDQLDWPGIWRPDGATVRAAEALAFDAGPLRAWATQLLNRLLVHGRRVRDSPHPQPPVLHDTTRERHPRRVGMFTCWDTRKNHRPANFGSRIDYLLCSPKLVPLVADADIQPRLLGSDHCPVYVVFQDTLAAAGEDDTVHHTVDYLNPPGRFVHGQRVLPPDEDAALLRKRVPQSARRLPQFANRRHVFNMFRQAAAATAAAAAAEAATPAASTAGVEEVATIATTPEQAQVRLPDIFQADPVEFVAYSDDDDDDDESDDDDLEDFDEDDDVSQKREESTTVPDRAAFFGAVQRTARSASTPGAKTPADRPEDIQAAGIPSTDADALLASIPPVAEGSTASQQRPPSPPRTFFRTASASAASSAPPSERSLVRSRSASSTVATGPATRPTKKAKTTKTAKAKTAKPTTGIQTSMSRFLLKPAQPEASTQPPEDHKEGPNAAVEGPVATQTPTNADPSADPSADPNDADADDGFDAVELVRSVEASRASWSRLGLGQRQAPLCEHGEPCKTYVTRKAGVNSGRSFYMCARPPGPLGRREKGTPWQCTTFVWCRDWRPADQPEQPEQPDQPGDS